LDFGRLITALVTPFDKQLNVDIVQFEKLMNFAIDQQKADALVICGTTGESPTLLEQEKQQLFEHAVRIANKRCKIIAGTGSYDTQHSIHLTKIAENAGVDGVLVVAPYYNRPSQEGLFQHFQAIAKSTTLPIMLYNIPSRTGINIDVATTIRLATIPNIVATKESSGDLDQMAEIIAGTDSSFKLYSGDDNLTLPVLAIGGYGVVSVASHVIGAEIQSMIQQFLHGEVAQSATLHAQLMPIFKGLFQCPHRVPNPVPVKYALQLLGYDVGGVRLPLVSLTDTEQQFIQTLFRSRIGAITS
jgi:4-hydroxy-tetrahydrodipicolinate synthase